MRKLLVRLSAILVASVLALVGLAYAQVLPYVQSISVTDAVQIIPRGAPIVGNVYASTQQLRSWMFSSNSQQGSGTPAASTCGTSPAVAAGSTDYAGTVTLGTGTPTGCTLTFSVAYAVAPSCVVTSRTAPATTTPAYTVTTATIVITQAAVNSTIWDWVCIGKSGS